ALERRELPGSVMSGTDAQCPNAQKFGHSGTPKKWSTSNRPCSFSQGSEEMRGLGTVPAVHTKVRDGIETPSVKKTLPSVTLLTRVLRRTSTSRPARTFSVYRPKLSPSSGKIAGPEWTRITRNISSLKL